LSYVTKFTNTNGVRLMKSLFAETCDVPTAAPVYTLYDFDKDGRPSLYRLYMEMADPTEYQFAKAYLHDWKHWKALCASDWFRPYVDRWREELELLVKSKILMRVINDSLEDGKEGQSAAKFLLEKGWGDKATKGRPSKEDIRQAADRMAENGNRLDSDIQRLGLLS
jgi:hypothetical protein